MLVSWSCALSVYTPFAKLYRRRVSQVCPWAGIFLILGALCCEYIWKQSSCGRSSHRIVPNYCPLWWRSMIMRTNGPWCRLLAYYLYDNAAIIWSRARTINWLVIFRKQREYARQIHNCVWSSYYTVRLWLECWPPNPTYGVVKFWFITHLFPARVPFH